MLHLSNYTSINNIKSYVPMEKIRHPFLELNSLYKHSGPGSTCSKPKS